MTENEPTKETTLTADDLSSLGAALENYVAGEAEAEESWHKVEDPEAVARKRLRKQDPKDVSWWGVTPPAERGSGPRPGCTYRAARRNLARAAGWPIYNPQPEA
jgi:hypothetical protein